MPLLLCAATEFEIEPTIHFIKEEKIKNVEVVITGVGMMATAYTLIKNIVKTKPDFILQAGVAGSLNKNFPLTKIVLVENENIGDLGVEENGNFTTLFDLHLLEKNVFPWKDGRLPNHIDVLKQPGLHIVDGVTVNEISTSIERINYYKNQLNASVESMEGAALHFVALQEKIPFLQMRSLSNFAGERDKSKWMMKEAIANLNFELQKLLLKILMR